MPITIERELRELVLSSDTDRPKFYELGIQPTRFRIEGFRLLSHLLEGEFPRQTILNIATENIQVIDYITRPRSVGEFKRLKKSILEIVCNSGESDPTSKVFWLTMFCYKFGIFPCQAEVDLVKSHNMSVDEALVMYESLITSSIDIESKHISIKRSKRLRDECLNSEVRFGAIGGKFRLGLHNEHIELMREAKEVLGTDGVLLVFLDKKTNITSRKGNGKFCLTDNDRIKALVHNQYVDFVTLVGKDNTDQVKHRKYMENLWKRVGIDYYFVGARDDEYFNVFEDYCRNNGILLLWLRDTNTVSTSQIIADLQGMT